MSLCRVQTVCGVSYPFSLVYNLLETISCRALQEATLGREMTGRRRGGFFAIDRYGTDGSLCIAYICGVV